MNTNDIVYKVAAEARKLGDESIDMLRRHYSGALTKSGSRRETLGMTRGELIEAILVEELVEEFPKEVEDAD
jgi:hypothetical protein